MCGLNIMPRRKEYTSYLVVEDQHSGWQIWKKMLSASSICILVIKNLQRYVVNWLHNPN